MEFFWWGIAIVVWILYVILEFLVLVNKGLEKLPRSHLLRNLHNRKLSDKELIKISAIVIGVPFALMLAIYLIQVF